MTRKLPLRLILVIVLAVLAVMAPAAALVQGGPSEDGDGQSAGEILGKAMQPQGNHQSGQSQNQSSGSQNQTQNQNQTQSQNQSQGQSQNQSQEERGTQGSPPGDQPGAGTDRRPVDPVAIRDNATGFRSEAQTGSPRPAVAMDAGRAMASLHRDGIHSLGLQLDTLLEYEDENDNGAYDIGETVHQRIPLRGGVFEMVVDAENQTRDVVYPIDNGQLILRFHFKDVQNAAVGAKFDVIIDGYPYQGNDTHLALGMRVDSQAGLKVDEVHGEPALVGQTGEQVPYLSWEGDVQVDNATHSVGSSIHLSSTQGRENADNAILYWSYPQGESIHHDPILGVTPGIDAFVGDWAPYLLGAAGVAALMGIGYTARRRTRL